MKIAKSFRSEKWVRETFLQGLDRIKIHCNPGVMDYCILWLDETGRWNEWDNPNRIGELSFAMKEGKVQLYRFTRSDFTWADMPKNEIIETLRKISEGPVAQLNGATPS